jgi:hypothetical protein
MVYLYYANWDTAVLQAKARLHSEEAQTNGHHHHHN